jgi:predicted O-methyltransferase YrrM
MKVTSAPAASRAGGTAYELIDGVLSDIPEYRAFRAGEMSRELYSAWVCGGAIPSEAAVLNEDQLNLSTRFPLDDKAFVQAALDDLRSRDLISETAYPEADFEAYWERVTSIFMHEGRRTYIFPEEARLLFALTHIVRPQLTVFAGSYYAYWAVWAMPGISAAGGRAVLVDIDHDMAMLGRRNLEQFGMTEMADVIVEDAIEVGSRLRDVDLCVLDAEGPKDHPVEDLRDKAIYYPISGAITSAIRTEGLLVAHNVLVANISDNPYFAGRIRDNTRQFRKWQAHYDRHCLISSSEGVGVYRRGLRA